MAQSAAADPPFDADSATALAKKLQNPVGDLYSFPFQNNTNFNCGPHKGTQDILNDRGDGVYEGPLGGWRADQ
jgi:hypothetical protein